MTMPIFKEDEILYKDIMTNIIAIQRIDKIARVIQRVVGNRSWK
jgi:hypothetical protein